MAVVGVPVSWGWVVQGAWRKAAPVSQQGGNQTVEAEAVYNMGGPCVRAISRHKRSSKGRRPAPAVVVNECAKELESLNQVALDQIEAGSGNGLVVEYRQLPEVSVGCFPQRSGAVVDRLWPRPERRLAHFVLALSRRSPILPRLQLSAAPEGRFFSIFLHTLMSDAVGFLRGWSSQRVSVGSEHAVGR